MTQLTKSDFDQHIKNGGKSYSAVLWIIRAHKACIDAYEYVLDLEKKYTSFSTSPDAPVLPLNYFYVDIDESPTLVMKHSIRTAPFLVIFDPMGVPVDILKTKSPVKLNAT